MLGDDVTARLEGEVPALAGLIGTAGQLADAMQRNALAQRPLSAFVLPLGLRGGGGEAATGVFRQAVNRMVGVVLVVREAADALGARAVAKLEPLIEDVVAAIVGWAPDWAVGVFKLSRGELLSMGGGACTYQLDFILDDQLRI